MTEYREVIRRLKASCKKREIMRETGIHRTIIRKIEKVAIKMGWLLPTNNLPTEDEIEDVFGKKKKHYENPLNTWEGEIKEWVEKEYSYVVIHQLLLQRGASCSEATARRYIKSRFPQAPKRSMRRETIPGEVMEVDFGFLGITFDHITNRRRKTYVFSARLRHSRDAYRETVFEQHQQIFFRCHIHAFEHFGGVPVKVVPDNLKAAVIKSSFTDPLINRVYQKLAEHYGFLVSPCLPRRPEHKGGVENDIKYVKRNFWPLFVESQKVKGIDIPDAHELKQSLVMWNNTVAQVRTIRGVGLSPKQIFESEEKIALKALPLTRWDEYEWDSNRSVRETWEVQFDNAFYSVPYKYVGKKVDILGSSSTVHIFFEYKQIAMHERARKKWVHVKKACHAPPNVEAYMNTTRESVSRWAYSIGPSVGKAVELILDHKSVDGLRPARSLIALQKTYGDKRLEAACERALLYDTVEYKSIKSILQNELDKLSKDKPVEHTGQQLFQFTREYGFFNPKNTNEKEGEKKWMN